MIIFSVALIIVFLCIGLGVIFYNEDSKNEKYVDILALIGGIALLIALAALIISVILSFVLPYKYETKIVNVKPIYSVEDITGINGRFVIGTGNVDQDIVYCYYVQEKEGLKLEYVNSNDAYIVESDKKPVIETIKKYPVYTKPWIEKFIGIPPMLQSSVTYYKLFVPENTVKKVFDLQLRN